MRTTSAGLIVFTDTSPLKTVKKGETTHSTQPVVLRSRTPDIKMNETIGEKPCDSREKVSVFSLPTPFISMETPKPRVCPASSFKRGAECGHLAAPTIRDERPTPSNRAGRAASARVGKAVDPHRTGPPGS